jgi:riboflavin biosynthesis pyrimidine reductase
MPRQRHSGHLIFVIFAASDRRIASSPESKSETEGKAVRAEAEALRKRCCGICGAYLNPP